MKRLALALLLGLSPLVAGCPALIATGVGGGVLAAEDRRTVGTITEDNGIELKASQRIRERHSDKVNINVTGYNRIVLLTGEVPDDATRRDIERLARSVENVRGVNNALLLGATSSFGNRANDSLITSKVKARYVDADKFQANHVKVVTEAGTVFLLGLVKRQEARDAAEITRTTSGVKRVVTVFEYLD